MPIANVEPAAGKGGRRPGHGGEQGPLRERLEALRRRQTHAEIAVLVEDDEPAVGGQELSLDEVAHLPGHATGLELHRAQNTDALPAGHVHEPIVANRTPEMNLD